MHMHKRPISRLLTLAHVQGLTPRVGVALPARALLGRPVTALLGTARLPFTISQTSLSIPQISASASLFA